MSAIRARSGAATVAGDIEPWERTRPSAEALDYVQKATERFPRAPRIWEIQGKLLAATNRWQEAVQAYSKPIELTTNATNGISLLRKQAFEGRAGAYRGLGETRSGRLKLPSTNGSFFMQNNFTDDWTAYNLCPVKVGRDAHFEIGSDD